MRVSAGFGILALLATTTTASLVSMTVAINFARAEGAESAETEVSGPAGDTAPSSSDFAGASDQSCSGPREWVAKPVHFGHGTCRNNDCRVECSENTKYRCEEYRPKKKDLGGYREQCFCCEHPETRAKPKPKAKAKAKRRRP